MSLLNILKKRIAEEGPISVADFMEAALADPNHGYYRGRDPLGQGGDFTTAPEISQMFGEILGLWCAVIWDQMGRPKTVNLVETGPGRGTLMHDMVRAAGTLPGFKESLSIHLVETSPVLKERQESALAHMDQTVAWHTSIDTLPDGPLIVISNEFFDALPVRQFIRLGSNWHERLVDLENDALCFSNSPIPAPNADIGPKAGLSANNLSIAETCPVGESIANALAARIVRFGGAALIIDYGYSQTALGDSLQAVKDHAYHPVLETPGDADLTAHVDFEALAQAARRAGAKAYRAIPQGTFLRRLGIEARAQMLSNAATDEQREDIATALKRLIHDDEMGTLFKVLAVAHPALPIPPGFDE